jgi:hypothetical protein
VLEGGKVHSEIIKITNKGIANKVYWNYNITLEEFFETIPKLSDDSFKNIKTSVSLLTRIDFVHPSIADYIEKYIQGSITKDSPYGFEQTLNSIPLHATKNTCVVITKSPETVLIILPSSEIAVKKYGIFDSHKRDDTNYAYIFWYNSIEDLIKRLNTLFTPSDLDVADFYNAFSATAFYL